MTVGELIEKLREYDESRTIVIRDADESRPISITRICTFDDAFWPDYWDCPNDAVVINSDYDDAIPSHKEKPTAPPSVR